jgi:hypothetical protein
VDGETVGLHHVAASLRRRMNGVIGLLRDVDGNVMEDPADVAELVRTHYKAVFAAPDEPAPEEQRCLPAIHPGMRGGSCLPPRRSKLPTPTPGRPLLDEVVPQPVVNAEDSDAVLSHAPSTSSRTPSKPARAGSPPLKSKRLCL